MKFLLTILATIAFCSLCLAADEITIQAKDAAQHVGETVAVHGLNDPLITGTGVLTEFIPGLAYLKGKEGRIFEVDSSSKKVLVFVPEFEGGTFYIGEPINYGGLLAQLAEFSVVNTEDGYIYRRLGKTVQEKAMEDVAKMQKEMVAKGITANAIPINMIPTKDQEERERQQETEQRQNRNYDHLLTFANIFLAFLACERLLNILGVSREIILRSIRSSQDLLLRSIGATRSILNRIPGLLQRKHKKSSIHKPRKSGP